MLQPLRTSWTARTQREGSDEAAAMVMGLVTDAGDAACHRKHTETEFSMGSNQTLGTSREEMYQI